MGCTHKAPARFGVSTDSGFTFEVYSFVKCVSHESPHFSGSTRQDLNRYGPWEHQSRGRSKGEVQNHNLSLSFSQLPSQSK